MTTEATGSEPKKTWIGRIIEAVLSIFHKAETVVDDIFKVADKVVNEIKVLEPSAAVQWLESGIETLFPASIPFIDGIRLFIPKAAGLIANVDSTVTTDEAKIEAFLKHLEDLEAAGELTLKAGALNTLNAAIQQFISTNQGITTLTPQMSLAGAQVAHDQTLGLPA
jgi:hypothetical protein